MSDSGYRTLPEILSIAQVSSIEELMRNHEFSSRKRHTFAWYVNGIHHRLVGPAEILILDWTGRIEDLERGLYAFFCAYRIFGHSLPWQVHKNLEFTNQTSLTEAGLKLLELNKSNKLIGPVNFNMMQSVFWAKGEDFTPIENAVTLLKGFA